MSRTIFKTELTRSECLEQLRRHSLPGGRTPWVEGTISAKIRGDKFRLFAWGPANVRNAFAPFFYGRLEECNGKTRIRGCFRMHTATRVFLAVWFGGLAIMGGLLVLLPPSAWGNGRPPPAIAILAPGGMMLLGFGLIRFVRWHTRGQTENLRCFLERELKGRRNPLGEH